MPITQTQDTTSTNPDALLGRDLDEFHATLRAQATQAIRGLLERVMREELTALLGAEPGEQANPARTGWRNGSDQRDLVTSAGKSAGIRVPGSIRPGSSSAMHAPNRRWWRR